MSRVVLVVDRYVPEARSAAHLFHDLACALAARGHEVDVITKYPVENLPEQPPPASERSGRVTIRRLRSPLATARAIWIRAFDQLAFAVAVGFTLVRHEDRSAPLIVYSPPLILAAVVVAVSRLTRRPVVVNLHDIYPRTAVELGQVSSKVAIACARMMERFVYRMADALVVPAPGSVEYLTEQAGIDISKATLVYNWVELAPSGKETPSSLTRASMGLAAEQFIVTYAGVVGLAQDLSAVLEAAMLLAPEEDIVFLIVGEGPMLAQWMRQASSNPRVKFLPTLPRDQYGALLRLCDVALLALSERLLSPAIPGKLQSIMAAIRPVIAVVPARSDAARVVGEAGCGIVTHPGNGAELVAAIRRLRADPALAASMAEAGHAYAARHFSLEHATSSFESVLASVAPERSSVRT